MMTLVKEEMIRRRKVGLEKKERKLFGIEGVQMMLVLVNIFPFLVFVFFLLLVQCFPFIRYSVVGRFAAKCLDATKFGKSMKWAKY